MNMYATARRRLRSYCFCFVRLGARLTNCPAALRPNTTGSGLPYLWIEGSAFLVIHTKDPQRKVGWGLSLAIEGCLYPGDLPTNEERGLEAPLEKQFLWTTPPPFFGPPLRIEEAHAIISFLIDAHLSPSIIDSSSQLARMIRIDPRKPFASQPWYSSYPRS